MRATEDLDRFGYERLPSRPPEGAYGPYGYRPGPKRWVATNNPACSASLDIALNPVAHDMLLSHAQRENLVAFSFLNQYLMMCH